MRLRLRQAAHVGLALATASAGLNAGSVASAQYFPYLASRPVMPYGPADPCARTAAERRLGWGIVGLLAGAWAGGAAAAAGVVAEGAALGGFVGSIIGGNAGARSAACGTAALAAASGAYGPYYGQAWQGGHPTYAVAGPQPVSFYEFRRTYRSFPVDPSAPQAFQAPVPQGDQSSWYSQGQTPQQQYAPAPQQYPPQYAPQQQPYAQPQSY